MSQSIQQPQRQLTTQTTPFPLAGDFDPDCKTRRYTHAGDVWYLPREEAFLYVKSTTEHEQRHGVWLSEPVFRPRRPIPLGGDRDLWFLEQSQAELFATDVPNQEAVWFLTDTEPAPTLPESPPVSQFEFEQLQDKSEVRRFLEHPLIDHPRGNAAIWKAAFGARYRGALVAVAVLGIPNPPSRYDGQTIVIDRYAAHPNRPPNTGTWLLSRVREWAELEGYCWLAAKAGIGGNEGTIYEALGLEQKSPAEIADGSGWANRPNRDTWDRWKKRPYAQPLGPPGVRFRRFDKHDRWQKARGQDESLPGAQSRLSSLKTAEGVSVDDCYLMRYDHHLVGVRDFFDRVANRPPKVEEATAIFVAAANDEPIAMHLCEPGSGDESDQLALVDYAHRETGVNYPVNVGAWTAGKARQWASLSDYGGIIGRPESVSHRAVLERANIPIRG